MGGNTGGEISVASQTVLLPTTSEDDGFLVSSTGLSNSLTRRERSTVGLVLYI